jgi:hypothetical protein
MAQAAIENGMAYIDFCGVGSTNRGLALHRDFAPQFQVLKKQA